MMERIQELRAEGESAVAAAGSAAELEELRIRLLGRKAELPQLLRGVRDLPAEERGPVGKAANEARAALEALIAERSAQIDADELDARLREDRVDVTLPGDPVQPIGRLHLITQTRRDPEAVFTGPEREVRMRPHFFPFTEPSVEVDVSCFRCGGTGALADGSRCPLCKGERWIEILGAGMVDPNVFESVRDHGYDPDRIQGFAFGMGIERIAMLKHEVPDLRLFYDNDLRFVGQFG